MFIEDRIHVSNYDEYCFFVLFFCFSQSVFIFNSRIMSHNIS